MRKLMWFTLGFAAACTCCVFLRIPWLLAGVCLFIPVAGFSLLGKLFPWSKATALLLLGGALGFGWFSTYDTHYLAAARNADGVTMDIAIEIIDFSYQTDYGVAADSYVELDGKPYRIRVYLNEEKMLAPGDRVEGSFRFRYTGPGAETPNDQSGKGIFLFAYQRSKEVTHLLAEDYQLQDYPAWIRNTLIKTIESTFPADTAGFAKALLLGDRTGIDYETNTAFSVSGISHVIAVSGLHVSILFSVVYFVTGRRRIFTVLLGIPVLMLFAAVAGFTPSITRAVVMHILMMIALLFDREYDAATALSFSVLVMLVVNPLTVISVSAQLSVGCTAGILLFSQPIRNYLDQKLPAPKRQGLLSRLKNWLIGSTSVTLGAMTVTTPFVAGHFGMISLVGVLTNIVTLWVISFIFYGIMAVCLVGLFYFPLAKAWAWIISWPIRFVLTVSGLLAKIPMAAVYTCSIYIVIWLVMVYLLLAVMLIMKKKQPLWMSCCAVIALVLALLASWVEPMTDECRMTVLDVGQGQCILLQSGGRTYVVDCGGDYDEQAADTAAEMLLSQGIGRIDGLILTHYDADHAGGAAYLLSRVDAAVIFVPDTEDAGPVTAQIADISRGQLYPVAQDVGISFGNATITLFAPIPGMIGNESSLCVLFQVGECDILITGDRNAFGERMLLRNAALPELEVLVAGHHGSKYSTCTELLDATSPEIVMISAGADNSFGHPAQELLDRLAMYGCWIYRTDTMGTIIFRR